LTINVTDNDWDPGTLYDLKIKSGIKNSCDLQQGEEVHISDGVERGLFRTKAAVCSPPVWDDGLLPEGFISSVEPSVGTVDFPLTSNSIRIFFNQQMRLGEVDDIGNYELKTDNFKDKVDLISAVYNNIDFSVTLTFDTTDPDWQPDTWYDLAIKSGIKNVCEQQQGSDVKLVDNNSDPVSLFQTGSQLRSEINSTAVGKTITIPPLPTIVHTPSPTLNPHPFTTPTPESFSTSAPTYTVYPSLVPFLTVVPVSPPDDLPRGKQSPTPRLIPLTPFPMDTPRPLAYQTPSVWQPGGFIGTSTRLNSMVNTIQK
jgi:hypothetical protein